MINERVAETKNLPDHFPVTVIMERRPAQVSQWVDYVWKAIGVTVGSTAKNTFRDTVLDTHEQQDNTTVTYLENDVQLHIYSGFKLCLYVDECDSYYRNLMSPTPHCFVVVRQDDDHDDAPQPFLVSISFDEAHAYLEGDDTVFAVDMPPELYRWTEAFVLTHYCPEERKKRKRKDWREQAGESSNQASS